jgi:hypothetical protein
LAFILVSSLLPGGLNGFLQRAALFVTLWNGMVFTLLRLALHPKNRTLHPVQLPDLGLRPFIAA